MGCAFTAIKRNVIHVHRKVSGLGCYCGCTGGSLGCCTNTKGTPRHPIVTWSAQAADLAPPWPQSNRHVNCALCTGHSALCVLHCALCIMHWAFGIAYPIGHNSQCPMPDAQRDSGFFPDCEEHSHQTRAAQKNSGSTVWGLVSTKHGHFIPT